MKIKVVHKNAVSYKWMGVWEEGLQIDSIFKIIGTNDNLVELMDEKTARIIYINIVSFIAALVSNILYVQFIGKSDWISYDEKVK